MYAGSYKQHWKNSCALNASALDRTIIVCISILHEATRDHIHDLIDTDYDNSLVAEL